VAGNYHARRVHPAGAGGDAVSEQRKHKPHIYKLGGLWRVRLKSSGHAFCFSGETVREVWQVVRAVLRNQEEPRGAM
jgi:hypothetical protein